MKTNILSALVLTVALIATSTTFAAGPSGKRSADDRALDRFISRHLQLPTNGQEQLTGEVYISCTVDAEGRIQVLDCNSTNASLKERVARKPSGLTLRHAEDLADRTLHMRVVYRPERTGN